MIRPLRAALRCHRRRLAAQDGYSLVELLTAMSILSIVLSAIITIFVAGLNAQVTTTQRVTAQQEARLAVDRLRREVHCASSATPAGGPLAASVTLTLPAACPSPETSVTWRAVSISGGEWQLQREGAVVAGDIVNGAETFSYAAPTGTTFGALTVSLRVNVRPDRTHTEWHLQDEIVLRNARPS